MTPERLTSELRSTLLATCAVMGGFILIWCVMLVINP